MTNKSEVEGQIEQLRYDIARREEQLRARGRYNYGDLLLRKYRGSLLELTTQKEELEQDFIHLLPADSCRRIAKFLNLIADNEHGSPEKRESTKKFAREIISSFRWRSGGMCIGITFKR